jgi:hypothetical protein
MSECITSGTYDAVINPKVSITSPISDASIGTHTFSHTYAERLTTYTGGAATTILSYTDSLPGALAISKYKSIWDLGDGRQLYGNNIECIFTEPGEYNITLTVIDGCGLTYKLPIPYICKLVVKDVIDTGVVWTDQTPLTGVQSHMTQSRQLVLYKSWQYLDDFNTVNLYVSGSDSLPLDEKRYNSEKHAHLLSTHRLVYSTGTEQDSPVTTLSIPQYKLYLDSTGNITSEETPILIGSSGSTGLSYVDDLPCTVNIFASIDSTDDYYNTKSSAISVNISEYTSDTFLNITTTGLPTFTLSGVSGIRFENTDIPLTVTVVTSNNILLPEHTSNLENITLTGSHAPTFKENYPNKPYLHDPIFHSVVFNTGGSTSYTTVISATGEYDDSNNVAVSVTGKSSSFTVVPASQVPAVSKISEDNNLFKIIKSFILQETINSKTQFVDGFLKSTIGDNTSPASYLGTQVYEKISNFVKNISDVDTCNISSLVSLAKSVGYNNISEDDTKNWPSEFKRMLDLLSISQQKLFGYRTPELANFDKKGFINNPQYGANLGELIGSRSTGSYSCNTYTVSAGVDIVAKQIFNNEFIHITPMLINDNTSIYPLSSYQPDWGWGLYTDADTTGVFDLHENYEFYNYVTYDSSAVQSQYESLVNAGTFIGAVSGEDQSGNIINWFDPGTTVSYLQSSSDWDNTMTQIIEKELRYRLDIL